MPMTNAEVNAEVGPVLASMTIGITGKRDLLGKDEAVRAALAKVFDQLDRDFPITPKTLLTSLAEGTDRIAAEEARGRAHWQTVAVLPLEAGIYAQDFDAASAGWLRNYLASGATRVKTLPLLIDPATGRAYEPQDVARIPDRSNPARAAHYEQAGLYIANVATLLIAVKAEDEKPGKIGGAARIAGYRLTGQLDDAADDVVQRSLILPQDSPVGGMQLGPCWLIDLASLAGHAPREIWSAVRIFPPAKSAGPDKQVQMKRSLRLAHGIEEFNRRSRLLAPALLKEDSADAAGILRRLRAQAALIQVRMNRRVRQTAVLLALLFVAAVLSWEVFAERESIEGGRYAILPYVALAATAVAVYWFAQKWRWQIFAEDYRAVAEALRVQIAWWDAGLVGREYRVDQYYLAGSHGSLGRVRDAARSLVNSALLGADAAAAVPGAEAAWIDGQIGFFERRVDERQRDLVTVEIASWFLFIGGLGAALFLFFLEAGLRGIIEAALAWVPRSMAAAAALVLIVFLSVSFWARSTVVRQSDRQKPALKTWALASAMLGGAAVSAGVYDLSLPLCAPLGEAWVGIIAATFAASAGAIRFVADKLSWESEFGRYEDALETFRKAKDALAHVTAADAQHQELRRSRILLALGRQALAETEGWLRAHRERPLEPVVGA